jgi:hypothetical protein
MAGQPYSNDTSIADEADLWRRISPIWMILDENLGVWRVSSAAFDDSRDGTPLSVLLAEVVVAGGRSAQDLLSRFPGYCLAAITAGIARGCGQGVARTPLPEEPAHASVFGRKTKGVKKKLAKAATWVVAPPAESQ